MLDHYTFSILYFIKFLVLTSETGLSGDSDGKCPAFRPVSTDECPRFKSRNDLIFISTFYLIMFQSALLFCLIILCIGFVVRQQNKIKKAVHLKKKEKLTVNNETNTFKSTCLRFGPSWWRCWWGILIEKLKPRYDR